MNRANNKCERHKLVKLAMRMFGFGSKPKVVSHSKIDSDQKENLEKREFLKWQIGIMAGLDAEKVEGLYYVGNNTWRFNPAFGHVKEFIVLKDMTQRHQPDIRYGKVNDHWVKLQHKGYFIVENQES